MSKLSKLKKDSVKQLKSVSNETLDMAQKLGEKYNKTEKIEHARESRKFYDTTIKALIAITKY